MFFETIKVVNGHMFNLDLHMARLTKTQRYFFPNASLNISLIVPPECRTGLYRCRITYSQKIESIEFTPYIQRDIQTLTLINAPTINYSYKFCDRNTLEALKKASGYDEIIIVKNGKITDTTFSNLVFKNTEGLFTPSTFLLPGTRRSELLQKKIIHETNITISDLHKYNQVFLINAIIGLEDKLSFTIICKKNSDSFKFIRNNIYNYSCLSS